MDVKMDGRKTRRRKSVGNKRRGSLTKEEKPKSTEVMNEKEKQDRLEAASVLSSLMYLPPKSGSEADEDEKASRKGSDTPSNSTQSLNLRSLNLPGIPPGLRITPQMPRLGRPPKGSTQSQNARNNKLLAELENKLKSGMDRDSITSKVFPLSQDKTQTGVKQSTPHLLSSPLPLTLAHSRLSKQVPLTVIPQTQTVNQDVVKALRNAMAKNIVKVEPESSVQEKTEQKNGDRFSPMQSVGPHDGEKTKFTLSSISLKKSDASDTNLPLKKRRLVGLTNSTADSLSSETLTTNTSDNLATLSTCRQIEDIFQMETEQMKSRLLAEKLSAQNSKPEEGYRPVQVDPRTSLLMLSDLKFALTPDEDGDLPLHIAVVHEDTELVKKFIDIMLMSGKTVDRFNKLQQTPLHLAIIVNQPDIVSVLMAAGGNPNLLDRHGHTCIHSSICKQYEDCMDTVFLESKIELNLNCRDYEGYYPLHSCVELDHCRMLVKLVQNGADVNAQDGKAGRSVLMYAVEYNRPDIVRFLLENGADAEMQNYAGVTPLMIAQAGKMERVITLLNTALDNYRAEEQHYHNIQARKVPITRIPSRTDFSDYKSRLPSNGVPLIYEEFERASSESNSQDGRPVFSRQSSASSPIDLSMRGPSTPSPAPAPEPRGRPRKKGKKEPKNQKNKQSPKSNVIEKHASVVAQLESTGGVVDKSRVVQSDRVTTSVMGVNEKRAIDLQNFLRLMNPLYTQKLLENMSQAYGISLELNAKHQQPSVSKYDTSKDLGKIDKNPIVEPMEVDNNMNTSVSSNVTETSDKVKTVKVDSEKCKDLNEVHDNEKVENHSNVKYSDTNEKRDFDSGIGPSIEDVSGEIQTNSNSDNTDNVEQGPEPMEEEVGSPAMPVLSRATSEVHEESYDSDVEALKIPLAQSDSNSQLPEMDKADTEMSVCVEDNNELNTDNLLNTKSESEVPNTKSSENNFDNSIIKNTAKNSMSDDDLRASMDKASNEKDSVSKSEPANNSGRDSINKTDKLVTQIEQKPSEKDKQNEPPTSTNSIPSISNSVIDSRSGDISDHSDDSVEFELSDPKKNEEITGTCNVKTVESSDMINDKEGDKVVGEPAEADDVDNVRISFEDKPLVMDLDDDGDSNLVIDEDNANDASMQVDSSERTDKSNVTRCEKNEDKTRDSRNVTKINQSENVAKDGISKPKLGNDDTSGIDQCKDNEKRSESIDKLTGKSESTKPMETESISAKKDQNEIGGIKESAEKDLSKSDETLSNPSSTESVSVVDNLLKTGQSHVLYFHDGNKYKPVRIYIDNSEQSSKVLKQMMQSAQISTLDAAASTSMKHSVHVDASVNPSATVMTKSGVASTMSVNLPSRELPIKTVSNNSKVQPEMFNFSSVLSGKQMPSNTTSSNVSANGLTATNSNASYQNAYIQSLNSQGSATDSKKSQSAAKPTKRKSSPATRKSDTGTNKSHSDNKLKKTTVDNSDQSKTVTSSQSKQPISSTDTISKSMPPISSKSAPPISKTALPVSTTMGKKLTGTVYTLSKPTGSSSSLKTLYNEGTLTRVNPDIKSRLSKALQSSSRKTGLERGDSDSYLNGGSGLEAIPVIAKTNDTRQQL